MAALAVSARLKPEIFSKGERAEIDELYPLVSSVAFDAWLEVGPTDALLLVG